MWLHLTVLAMLLLAPAAVAAPDIVNGGCINVQQLDGSVVSYCRDNTPPCYVWTETTYPDGSTDYQCIVYTGE